MTTRLRRLFPYILLAPAVLPLVYVGGVLYPYISPKIFLLQGLGILALAVFAYLALAGQEFYYARLRAPAAWIPAALLFIEYAASLFGMGFFTSFWGLPSRGDGLLTSSVITAFFYLILLVADRAFLERLAKLVALTAGVVASIAVLQWAAALFGGQARFLPPVTGRIGSTLGNAAFLAGYLGMAFFVILIVRNGSSGLSRRMYGAAAALSALAIVFTATRGTILALLAALAVALAFAAWKGAGGIRRAARYGLVALAVLASLFFVFRSELSQSFFEPLKRVASISLSDSTVSSRLFVWSHITEEALRRPLSGYGAEHIAQLFDRVYDPGKILEQWFDRSHNAFLDYFAQYGVFGLALYLMLIGAFAAHAVRLYRREEGGPENTGFLFLLLIITYAAQNFFVFDTPSSFWLLYALFALLIVLLSDEPAAPLRRVFPPYSAGVAASLIALLIVPAVVLPLYANRLLAKGYLFHLTDVAKANAYFDRGLALGTYADLEYGYVAYDMFTARQATQLSGAERIAAYEQALSTLMANFEKYPYDARTATYLGHVLDTAPPEAEVDEEFDRQVLSRAMALSPLRAQAWYMTANISLRKADALAPGDARQEKYYREAIALLEEYAQKEPTLAVPRYILTTLYYKLGDKTTAKKWADEAYPLYTTSDPAAAGPAVKYYIALGDWQRAARFLADLVEEKPSDHSVLYDLAKVTYLAGDPATALRITEKLREIDPALLETDQNFLSAITAYERTQK